MTTIAIEVGVGSRGLKTRAKIMVRVKSEGRDRTLDRG